MNKPASARHFLSALCALTLCGTVAGSPAEIAPGRILVKRAAGLDDVTFAAILDRSGGRALRKLRGIDVHLVEVPEKAEMAVASALARNRHIAFAEPDVLILPVVTLNDPLYGQQWHLPKINAPAAWQYADGTGVTVAVLDTGVHAGHPDLAGKVLPGWNTVSNTSQTDDIHNHGTWVAGVVAATADNLIGGASTAPGASILPVRISDRSDGAAYYSDMADGIVWAADNGAQIANLSYHGAAGSSTVASAASYMMNRSGIVVVAAGNDNTDYGYVNHASLFVAGATTSSDVRAGYSSYGSFVDISAPGSSILTTDRNGNYSTVSGTSFATPNVAAVAALVLSANPSLLPTDVTAIISNTAVDLGSDGWDSYYGHGRVDALAATALAADAQTSDVSPPDTQWIEPTQGSTLTDTVSVVVLASDDFGVTRVELLVDGQVLAEETLGNNDRYTFAWNTASVRDGSHTLGARAYDAAGNVGTAQSLAVSVQNALDQEAPVVTITQPDGGSYDRIVTVSAFATDDQGVARIDIRGDGQLLCSGTSSATCNWNLKKLSSGAHTVTATAYDAAGNQGSASTTFTKADNGGNGGNGGKGKKP